MVDERFNRKFEQFCTELQTLGKEIPEKEVKKIVAGIIYVLEQHHVTYNQAHEILNLARESLNLRAAEVRL